MTVKGYIARISFRNPENGYSVLVLDTEAGEVTCVGIAGGYQAGETVEVEGNKTEHPLYGEQIKIEKIMAAAPSDRAGLLRYLGSGAIKGIGEKRAAKIVEHFGDDTFRILEEEPERLLEVKGMSEKMVRDIAGQLAGKREQRRAALFMQEYGISAKLCDKLYQMYGDEIYGILKNNPYRLADEVPAVGFKTADRIARKAGIAVNSEYRIRAGLRYVLETMTGEGHCYSPRDYLIRQTAGMLAMDPDSDDPFSADEQTDEENRELIGMQLTALALEHQLVEEKAGEEVRVYLNTYYRAEKECALGLKELMLGYRPPENAGRDMVRRSARESGIELDPSQEEAAYQCMQSGVFVLTGGPGTGKTTTINVIIRCLEMQGVAFELAAPTGRAAKRMTEATGYEARTIHRLLEIGADDEHEGFHYGRGEDAPLEADCVILDEVSMVDIHLMRALLRAMRPGSKLILSGDANQLPSVGPGQVLHDILQSGVFPAVELQVVHRQAQESHIIRYAHEINHGRHPDLKQKHPDFFFLAKDRPEVVQQYIWSLMVDVIPRHLGLTTADIQVLTPMRKGSLGVEGLNTMLQQSLNPKGPRKNETEYGMNIYREGDKVMQIRNNYEMEWEILGKYNVVTDSGKGIFNGDTGIIERIDDVMHLVHVKFDDGKEVYYNFQDLDQLELAYAVTIHKSQGSEYPVVILPVLSGPPRLLTRNLFYTAVTRARQCVILLGSEGAFYGMIDRDYIKQRYTSLAERLR